MDIMDEYYGAYADDLREAHRRGEAIGRLNAIKRLQEAKGITFEEAMAMFGYTREELGLEPDQTP